MSKIPVMYKTIGLLLLIIIIFCLNMQTGLTVSLIVFLLIIISEPKITKHFLSYGFLLFCVAALSIPLLFDFSLFKFLVNFYILIRGILIYFWTIYFSRSVESNVFFKKIVKILPDELTKIVLVSSKMLPVVKESFIKYKKEKRTSKIKIFEYLANFFKSLDLLAENLSKYLDSFGETRIIIVSGCIHQGKTTMALELADLAKKSGLRVAGIVALSENKDGKRYCYRVKNLKSDKIRLLSLREPMADYYEQYYSHYFTKDGISFALECISYENVKDSDVVFLDEIGSMELDDRGYAKSLEVLLKHKDIPFLVIVVRDKYVDGICKKFNIIPHRILKVGDKISSWAGLVC